MAGRHPFAELRAKMSPKAKARAARKAKAIRRAMDLAELRRALELSQQQLAKKLRVNQPEVAKIEKRTDMLLSTLGAVLHAMGADLKIVASFPDHEVQIRQLGPLTRKDASAFRSTQGKPRMRTRSLRTTKLASR
jgi:transcriptional regulator with XRE-family HTH domain